MVIVLALAVAIWPNLAIKMNAEGEPRIAEKDFSNMEGELNLPSLNLG